MARELTLCGVSFLWAAQLDPDRDSSGAPNELMPQARYEKAATTPLNPHGAGPFCRLKVPGLPISPGVYAVTVDASLVYVGKGQSLAARWGPWGYGTISPKNCYVGGQATNCKVNHRILLAARTNRTIDLWIHETDRPDELEGRLIRSLNRPGTPRFPGGNE